MRNWKKQTKRMKRIFAMLVAAMLCLSPLQQHVLAAEIPEEAVTPEDTAQPEKTTEPEETEVLEGTTPSEEETAPNGVTTPVEGEITPDTPEVPEGTTTQETPEDLETPATSLDAEKPQGAEENQEPVVKQELVQSVTEAAVFKAAVQEAVENEDPEITGVIYVNANFEPKDTTETTETPDDSVTDDVSSEEPEEAVSGETQSISGDDAEANDEASEEDAVKTEETSNEENEDLELTDMNISDEESEQEADAATPDETVSDETDDVQLSGTVQAAAVVETAGAPVALADEGDVQVAAPEGSANNPCKTLAEAADLANNLKHNAITIRVQSNLTATECASISCNKNIIIEGNNFSITRGENFKTISDNSRSWYNPAMIEVHGGATLTLKNVVLNDNNSHQGSIFKQASSETSENTNIVQDAMIATYSGDGHIVLDSGAVLENFGGMSAVRITGEAATFVMKNGSKIIGGGETSVLTDGTGAAGAVWIQNGTFTMESGSVISKVKGRAVYADGANSIVNIGGTITDIFGSQNVWQKQSGVAIHLRGQAKAIVSGRIENVESNGKDGRVIWAGDGGNSLELNEGSVISNCSSTEKYGGLIYVSGPASALHLDGTISDCKNGSGSLVYHVNSKYDLVIGPRAQISGNTCGSIIYDNSAENRNSQIKIQGIFTDNTCTSVFVGGNNGREVILYSGAKINKNTLVLGSVFNFGANRRIIMEDGSEVCDNKITLGSVISISGEGNCFTMNGGKISGNTATSVVTFSSGSWQQPSMLEINGGIISGNNTPHDFTIATQKEKISSISSYFLVKDNASIEESSVYFQEGQKSVTVNPGTKLGNANKNQQKYSWPDQSVGNAPRSVAELTKTAADYGCKTPFATFWAQNDDGTPVTVKMNNTDAFVPSKPIYVLTQPTDEKGAPVTSEAVSIIVAHVAEGGDITFNLPTTGANGVTLALVQPDEANGTLNLTTNITRLLEGNEPYEIPCETTFTLSADGLTGEAFSNAEKNVKFVSSFNNEQVGIVSETKAQGRIRLKTDDFSRGGNVSVYAVLTIKTKTGEVYTFLSNNVEIPMVASYTVTFNSNGGSVVASQRVEEGGTASRPTNPIRAGYIFNGWTMGGTAYNFTTPVTSDITLTAQWTANEPPAPTPTPTTPTTPTTTTPPAPAPLAMAPTVLPAATPTPAAPAPDAPVEIAEPETPLAEPEAPAAEPEEAPQQIEEPEVPLASGVQGSWALLNLLLMLFTAVSGLVLTVSAVRREEENEKRKKALRISSLVPAVVSVAVFVLTENLRAPMRFVNARTMWMVLFAAAQIALIVLSRKSEEEAQVEE